MRNHPVFICFIFFVFIINFYLLPRVYFIYRELSSNYILIIDIFVSYFFLYTLIVTNRALQLLYYTAYGSIIKWGHT